MGTSYYTLIGSLPALPRHFEQAERVPISQLQLDERLKMLAPRDAQVVDEMADFLAWERQPLERTDQEVLQHYDQFVAIVDNRFARELIRHAMTVRTIMAGLRCRRLQLEPPVGVAPVAAQIARQWSHPDFRLGGRYPWIADVDARLAADAPFDLERTRLDIIWRHTGKLAQQNDPFSFAAIVLYLIRWETVYRWIRRDAAVGQEKFEQLVSNAMGKFASMFEDEPNSAAGDGAG